MMHKAFDFPLEHNPFSNPVLWIFTAVTVILTTVLSGLYPAFVLSSFQPMESLKSINKNTFGKGISSKESISGISI
ncbi:MAG: hypothetical protein IPO37_10300 [Saprospiraceae bacterium]|nr:hypothetical protein [Saprospiraceae bacterium]